MLTLDVRPELEKQLAREANRLGISAEAYVLQMLEKMLPAPTSKEEFDAVMDEAIALFDDVPFGTKELRAIQDEELALEAAKQQRLLGQNAL